MIDVSNIPVREFVEAYTTRLISTAYISEPALDPLADDGDELAFLEELEGQTSSRRGLPEFIPEGVDPYELVNEHHGYGWTYVNAAFCYSRFTGNRFNGPDRGAWYATWEAERIETAHAEVAWHLTRELQATGVFENITAYRELSTSFATSFHDLSKISSEPFLHPDPETGYPEGQHLASQLLADSSNGVIYPSVRRVGGWCLAAFRPHLVQNIRQGDTWVFEWSGSSNPRVEKLA